VADYAVAEGGSFDCSSHEHKPEHVKPAARIERGQAVGFSESCAFCGVAHARAAASIAPYYEAFRRPRGRSPLNDSAHA
jgi:hypothetical protein